METGKHLRVFFLEDNQDDVYLELRELSKAGFAIEHVVARNRNEFLDKLPMFTPDVILADYSLPDITGVEALGLCKKMKVDAPVILITGEGNEQIAVDSLRLGAVDYIIKRNISGLPARVSRALEIWADRKARERAEAEEKRLMRLLAENQKMEAVGRLTSGIAHDFNNILTGILGYSELCLNQAPADSELHERLQSIITFSRRGADLIKQLLIFSKKVPMEFEVVDLNAFIRETVQFLRRVIEETIDIRLELGDDAPKIKCDTRQFSRVLMNLALNARDAMEGKGVVTISTGGCSSQNGAAPASSGERGNEYAWLSVSDTGIGIKKENLDNIFEPFFTTKAPGKGTGLGLSIVHSVVTAHGGTVKVDSEKGRGTRFEIFLPALSSDKGEHAASEPRAIGRVRGAGGKRGGETILLAEDEDLLRKLAVYALVAQGYRVIVAQDGKEALDMYKAAGDAIALVISDMIMPNMGGVDLFRKIKALNPRAKFILITGYSLTDQDRDTLDKMDAILTKPYAAEALTGMIREILDT